jgi:hypothetical protein
VFPNDFTPPDLTPVTASEILTLLSDDAVSAELRRWLGVLRGEVIECQNQAPMFDDAA